jgi:hypothetical protein
MIEMSATENESIHPRWVILFRFGDKKHLEQFRGCGLVYMNPRTYFTKLENDCVRADGFEGTDRIIQPRNIRELTVEGPIRESGGHIERVKLSILPSDMAGPVSIGWDKHDCNLFCMFAVTKPVDSVDSRNFKFGDSFVLVKNTQEFINRFCLAANAESLSCKYRCVEYYDAGTHSGDTGTFRKPAIFSYQSEFRFVVRPGIAGPRTLTLGSLLDITAPVLPLAEINQLVDFSTESAREAGLY